MTYPPLSAQASPKVAVCVTQNRVTLKIIDSELELSVILPGLQKVPRASLEGSWEIGIGDKVETEG